MYVHPATGEIDGSRMNSLASSEVEPRTRAILEFIYLIPRRPFFRPGAMRWTCISEEQCCLHFRLVIINASTTSGFGAAESGSTAAYVRCLCIWLVTLALGTFSCLLKNRHSSSSIVIQTSGRKDPSALRFCGPLCLVNRVFGLKSTQFKCSYHHPHDCLHGQSVAVRLCSQSI